MSSYTHLKAKLPSELNLHISRKFDASIDVWKINDLMKELKLELEARERVGNTERKEKKKYPETLEGLVNVNGVQCPYCHQNHFPD